MLDDLLSLGRQKQRKYRTDNPHRTGKGRDDLAAEPIVGRIQIHPQNECDDI